MGSLNMEPTVCVSARSLPEENSSIAPPPSLGMTLLEFVKARFVPDHVLAKGVSGRTHYNAILKHLLRPENVDAIFAQAGKPCRGRLRQVQDWPYLDDVLLGRIHAAHVLQLIDAAVAHGYSPQTVTHIRSVLGAIFSHAIREHCFYGPNPVLAVQKPQITRKRAHTLSPRQLHEVLRHMQHPEREIVLLSFLGNLTISEVCALQWNDINLSSRPALIDGSPVPARSIWVRRQNCAEHIHDIAESRLRFVTLSSSLRAVLETLRKTQGGASGFVVQTPSGHSVSPATLRDARLKPIGRMLGLPWLSWQSLKRGRSSLLSHLQKESAERIVAATLSMTETAGGAAGFAGRRAGADEAQPLTVRGAY